MRQSLSDLDKPAKLGQWGKTNRPFPELNHGVVATGGLENLNLANLQLHLREIESIYTPKSTP